MGDKDIALLCVDVHTFYRNAKRVVIAVDLLVGEVRAHMGRLDKGQQPDVHALYRKRRDLTAVHGRDMDAALVDQARAERQTLGRVMVAADDEYLCLAL